VIKDKTVQQMADLRERTDDQRIAEESRRIRQHRTNEKALATIAGKNIRSELLNKCCGNRPSVGVRNGVPYIRCSWCGSRVDNESSAEAVKQWNNPRENKE
jgi:hypothetical protein